MSVVPSIILIRLVTPLMLMLMLKLKLTLTLTVTFTVTHIYTFILALSITLTLPLTHILTLTLTLLFPLSYTIFHCPSLPHLSLFSLSLIPQTSFSPSPTISNLLGYVVDASTMASSLEVMKGWRDKRSINVDFVLGCSETATA